LIVLFASSLLLAFVSLVLASQLPAPAWLWALDATALCAAVALLSGLGLATGRIGLPAGVKPLSLPLISAAVALGARGWLVSWLSPPEPVPRIDFWKIQLAAGAVAGAAFALVGGAAALGRGGPWYQTALAIAAVAAGLYAMSPVLLRAGVPFDWRAFLGLAGLGLGAYAVVEAARRARRA
jgi:hypothetical protein